MTTKFDIKKEKVANDIASLWQPISEKEYKLLLDNLTLELFRKNQMIYGDLEKPTRAMMLIQGKAKVYKDGISGRNQILRVIKHGEFFGFRAHFAGEDYKTIATALEPCIVAWFPLDVLDKLIEGNNNICKFFLKYLSIELGNSDDRIVNLTQKHIRGRLAEALLFLADSYGLEEDGYTLSIYLSREDLANLSNMTTSNAIRTLSAFANEHLIAIDGRKIKLIQLEELKNIFQMG